MIEVKNLDKKYSNQQILYNVSFKIENPGLYIFCGINGSGKSTIVKILAKAIYKTSGEIICDDEIAYLPDKFIIPSMLLTSDYLKLMINMYSSSLNYKDILDEYKIPKKRVYSLSKGNYQKLGIAQLFLNDSDTYILDEPFDGLDDFAKKLLKDKISEKINLGKKVILIYHQKNVFNELKPIIYEVKEGKIYEKKKKKSNDTAL